MSEPVRVERSRTATRIFLGFVMVYAGAAHLFFSRDEFRAQVPGWIPIDQDTVVLVSGGIEIVLGLALLFGPRRIGGVALALFFVAVFPGNIGQYVDGIDAFGLDTDTKRLVRLFFQPVLVMLALWAAGFPRVRGRTQRR